MPPKTIVIAPKYKQVSSVGGEPGYVKLTHHQQLKYFQMVSDPLIPLLTLINFFHMAALGASTMLTMKSLEPAAPHEQVAFIRLKWGIYHKSVWWRKLDKSDLEHSSEQTPKKKKTTFRIRIWKCSHVRPDVFWWVKPNVHRNFVHSKTPQETFQKDLNLQW